jgi:hypothetical protein
MNWYRRKTGRVQIRSGPEGAGFDYTRNIMMILAEYRRGEAAAPDLAPASAAVSTPATAPDPRDRSAARRRTRRPN